MCVSSPSTAMAALECARPPAASRHRFRDPQQRRSAYLDLTSPGSRRAQENPAGRAPGQSKSALCSRAGISTTIEGLKGRKVGFPAKLPSREVTARTIFGTLKIDADFVELDGKDAAKRCRCRPALRERSAQPAGFRHLVRHPSSLAVPASGPLAAVYLPRKLGRGALPGFETDALETVQVTDALGGVRLEPEARPLPRCHNLRRPGLCHRAEVPRAQPQFAFQQNRP